MAGGRDIAGKTLLSCEAICYNGAAYNTTWGANSVSPTAQNQALFTLNSIFAAGVNQAMIHGFPYATAPGRHLAGLRRVLAVLQRSDRLRRGVGAAHPAVGARPRHRLLPRPHPAACCRPARRSTTSSFLRQKSWASTGIGPLWVTNDGTKLGWSHSFITRRRCSSSTTSTVRDGRLAPDGPAYKALVIGPD